jgi:hypothetical protein
MKNASDKPDTRGAEPAKITQYRPDSPAARKRRAAAALADRVQPDVERMIALVGDPCTMLDHDRFNELVDKGRIQAGQATDEQLIEVLGLGSSEHDAWTLIEQYDHFSTAFAMHVGFSVAIETLRGRTSTLPDFFLQTDLREVVDEYLVDAELREAWLNKTRRPSHDAAQARRAECPPYCVHDHEDDPAASAEGFWARGQSTGVPISEGQETEPGTATVALATWRRRSDELDRRDGETLVELHAPENAGCKDLTLLSLAEAERLGRMLVHLAETEASRG